MLAPTISARLLSPQRQGAPQSSGARVLSAQLGRDSTPDYQLVSPAHSFAPDAPQIICVWRVADVPPGGATLRGVWIAEDTGGAAPPNYQIAEKAYPLTQAGGAVGNFSLSKPNKGWPPGKYRLELYLDDKLAETVSFRVETAAEAAAYARIEPLVQQSEQLEGRGDYRASADVLRRALALAEQALGPEHADTAALVNNLALDLKEAGAYDESETLYMRAVALTEILEGTEAPVYAGLLSNLGELYNLKGDFVRAEQTLKRAAAVAEKALGPGHRVTALALNNLARTYQLKADYAQAEALYKRALPALEQSAGAESEDVATLVNNMAELYRERGDFAQSEPLYRRALAIEEKILPPDHPTTALTSNNLALLYLERGDYTQAEPLFKRALAADEKRLGVSYQVVAGIVNNLALLYQERGDYAQAEPLYQRALAIFERSLGAQHTNVAQPLLSLARLAAARGDLKSALDYLTRAGDVRERNLALVLTTGSEQQKQLYLDALFGETNLALSLHLQAAPTDAGAAKLALTTILRRKGRALDAVADQIGALRRRLNPSDQALLDQLSATRARLATLLLQAPGAGAGEAERQATAARLEADAQRLENEVSARSAEFRAQTAPVTLAAVQQAIPADAALIELARYYPFDFKAKLARGFHSPARYAAYVLRRDGAPAWVELGEAEPIERAIGELRRALATPNSTNVMGLARALDAQMTEPVRKLLGNTRHLLLSPDGALNLIPFGALVDEQNRYLIETYSITYLTSGRDLLRLGASVTSRQPPAIIANPAFDAAPQSAQSTDTSEVARRSADLRSARFTPLPGTAGEAQAISSVLSGAQLLTQAQATEAALKQVNAPLILHVATHGFFLADQPQDPAAAARGLALAGSDLGNSRGAPRENPLLRSGLALAGANQRRSAGGEDGVLTALEAAGLNLWGTKLVVLSACETGLGEIRATNSEGVYGLRRALVLAGSESQVMSLWQVDDAATRDLMAAYYKRLSAGEGRTDALRQVQLEMLKGGVQGQAGAQRGLDAEIGPTSKAANRSHPYFWAAFIQSGDWRAMNVPGAPAQ